jgi:amino acid adenylation domain-containing protein/non-ribosomal peptide synthase protein (TIGR01720 family)
MDPQMNTLSERLRSLSPEKRALLAAKLRLAAGGSGEEAALPPPDDGLSPSQQRMWLFDKIEGSSTAYNVVSALHIRGELDADALEWAFNQVVRRHEILRTRFVEAEGTVRQVVEPSLHVPVREIHAGGLSFERDRERVVELIAAETQVDFHLDRLPLLKLCVIRLGLSESVLVCVIHHILADGWSLRLLEREISTDYRRYLAGERSPAGENRLQYRHFVGRQKSLAGDGTAARQLSYWADCLDGLLPALSLPMEKAREAATGLEAASAVFSLPDDLRAKVEELAQQTSASLFMVLAAAFKLTLSYVSGADDIAVGTPVANRRERRFEDVIGLFSNTVVLRSRVAESMSFRQYLEVLRQAALDAYAHQDVPFEQVVDAVRPERSAAHTPLFQVLFALQSVDSSELSLPGLSVTPVQLPRPSIEFDIIMECFFQDASNDCVLSYRKQRLSDATIRRMQHCFVGILEAGCTAPDTPVGEIFCRFAVDAVNAPAAPPCTGAAGSGRLVTGLPAFSSAPQATMLFADEAGIWDLVQAAHGAGVPALLLQADTPKNSIRRTLEAHRVHLVVAPEAARERLSDLGLPCLSLRDILDGEQSRAGGAASPSPSDERGSGSIILPGLHGDEFMPGADLDEAAGFLAEQGGFERGRSVLIDRGLPADLLVPALIAVFDRGAAPVWIEEGGWEASAIAARIRAEHPCCILVRPSTARMLDQAVSADPGLGDGCGNILLHGGPTGVQSRPFGDRLIQCWSLPEAGGPFLVQRAGPDGPITAHRRGLSVVSAAGQALPADIPSELCFHNRPGSGVRTGLRGRIVDGGIRLDPWQPASEWVDGQRVQAGAVERLIAQHSSVAQAVVQCRVDRDEINRLVAYVALNQRVAEDVLASWLRARVPESLIPAIVLVSSIPLTADGRVDFVALQALPVLDSCVLAASAPSRLEWVDTSADALEVVEAADVTLSATAAADQEPMETAPAAHAAGPPLQALKVDLSLPAVLARAARDHGDREVVHVRDADGLTERQSYGQLADDAARILAGLRAIGMQPGDRLLLQLHDNRDFLAGFWGCILGGFLPVLAGVPESYEPAHKDTAKILNAWRALGVGKVLSSRDKLEPLGRLAAATDCPFDCVAIETLREREPDRDWHRPAPEDAAMLLLTSGSTGAPKAVVQSHANLVRRSAATAQRFGFDHRVVSFNWMPLDHVGGIVMFHLLDTFLGAQQIHCPTSLILADPLRWLDWLDQHRVTNTWAPNFAYALINDRLDLRPNASWDLSRLSFILNGGEAIVPRTARTFLSRLARHGLASSAMKPAWGMSETCSGVTFSERFDLASTSDDDSFVDVGTPIPEIEIRILDAQGQLRMEGEVGHLQIRGATVTTGYFNNPEATEQAFTADGWFVTGDLAVLRERSLTITGREKDLIIINGLNYFGHEIEQVVEEVPCIREAHVAACGVRRRTDDTDRLAIFYSADLSNGQSAEDLARAIRRTVLDRCGIVPRYLLAMAPDALPRTSIGKIERSRLADRLSRGEFDLLLQQEEQAEEGAGAAADRLRAWFYEPVWVKRARIARPGEDACRVVVTGISPHGSAVAEALRSGARTVVSIAFGGSYARDAQDRFTVPASDEAAYRTVLAALAEDGVRACHIVHCGALRAASDVPGLLDDAQAAHEPALLSVAALARVAADPPSGICIDRLDVVTSGGQAVDAGECIIPANAALNGFTRSLAQEIPGVAFRQIDLVADRSGGAHPDLAGLLAELDAGGVDDVVALRGRRRLVPRLGPVAFGQGPLRPRQFQGASHLITGGLGGIGVLLAEKLLEDPDAQVVLIGRCDPAALPPDRREALARLSSYGKRLTYEAADVCDVAALVDLRDRVEARTSLPLATVFHLAGALGEGLVKDATSRSILEVMRAKTVGAMALHQAMDVRGAVEIIHFGSANGFFGGAGVAAYAAANSMLEALSRARSAEGKPTRCLHFTMWDETGMSRGYGLKQQTASRGFALLSPATGLASLAIAAASARPAILIGLDTASPNILSRVSKAPRSMRVLHLEAAGETMPELRDRFGTAVPSVAAVNAKGSAPVAAGEGRQLTAVEATLAEVWRSVLQIDVDDPEANFFELGGDSIMAIQVVARAKRQGIDLLPRQLFECQTLAALAKAASASVRQPLEEEVVRGDVPLGPVQHWFFERCLGNPHHFNQSVVLRVGRRLDLDLLGRAFELLLRHHDMLRARYAPAGGHWRQQVGEDRSFSLEDVELDCEDEAGREEAIRDHGSRLQAGLDLEKGPLVRAAYFRGSGARFDRLLIAVHHLIVDGVSWRIIQEDLQHLYLALLEGRETPELPPRTSSYRAWVGHWAKQAMSPEPETVRHWSSLAGNRTLFPQLDETCPNRRSGERAVEFELDAETTQALLQRTTRSCDAEITDVLLAALFEAYRAWAGGDSLYLTLESHGRTVADPDIDVSRTVGWFTALYPLLLAAAPDASLRERVEQVREQRRAVPDQGLSFGPLRYLGQGAEVRDVAWPRLSFNYLGRFDVSADDLLLFAEESPGDQEDPANLRINEIDVVGVLIQGRLKFSLNYCEGRLGAAGMGAFRDGFRAALEALAQLGKSDAVLALLPDCEWIDLDRRRMHAVAQELAERGIAARTEAVMPLRGTQQGLLFDALHGSGEGLYVSQLVNDFSGALDPEALRHAWQQIVARHSAYRTCFLALDSGAPVQVVLKDAVLPWTFLDWCGLPREEQESRFERLLGDDRRAGFDPAAAPLLRILLVRLADDRHRMLLTEHHAVSDGWSRGVVLRELATLYGQRLAAAPALAERAEPFARYVEWMRSFDAGASTRYWQDYLAGVEEPAPIAIAGSGTGGSAASHRCWRRISAERSSLVSALARSALVTPSAIVQTAWALLLSLYTGRADVVFGTTHSGRPAGVPAVEEIVGPFINTVPVRVRIDSYSSVIDCIRAVAGMQLDHADFGHLPPLEIKRASGLSGNKPLFETLFLVENFPLTVPPSGAHGLRVEDVRSLDETPIPLMVMLVPGDEYEIIAYHRESHFTAAAANELLDRFEIILEQICRDAAAPIDTVQWVGADERRQLIQVWNGTSRPYRLEPVHEAIARHARAQADAPAIASGIETLTYGELDRRIEALAATLRARGVGPESLVGVLLNRSPDMVVTLLAIWRAGGAYLPLDLNYPRARLEFMLRSSGARLIVSDRICRTRMDIPDFVDLVELTPDIWAGAPTASVAAPPAPPSGLAYVMYTSGSTGVPKGIQVEHGNVLNFLAAMDELLSLGDKAALLAVTSICFDISVLEMFLPLISGATLVVAGADEAIDPQHLMRLIRSHRISHMQATPATWQMLLDDGWENEEGITILAGGEALPERLARRLSSSGPLWNLYGPTEATVWCSAKRIGPTSPVTLGGPIGNLRCYILDDQRRPLPPGVPGELYIAGAGVARGYLGQEALTAARFLTDDVHPLAGERMYRSGDMARWLGSGEIEYLGRVDDQLKVRGFRVELGEIERVLSTPALVERAVVKAWGEGTDKRLVAYLMIGDEREAALAAARTEVADRLPGYMHPSAYVVLEHFPLTQNGKIDRNALPEPVEISIEEPLAAREATLTERDVALLFEALLRTTGVEPDSDFFALGGNSILAAQLSSRLRREHGVSVAVADIFEDLTVGRLAARIEALKHRPGSGDPPAENAIIETYVF